MVRRRICSGIRETKKSNKSRQSGDKNGYAGVGEKWECSLCLEEEGREAPKWRQNLCLTRLSCLLLFFAFISRYIFLAYFCFGNYFSSTKIALTEGKSERRGGVRRAIHQMDQREGGGARTTDDSELGWANGFAFHKGRHANKTQASASGSSP